MSEPLQTPLQESIIVLLATNNEQGRVAAGLLEASDFDEDYQEFAARLIKYQRTQNRSPGVTHLDDVFADIVVDTKHKRYRQTTRVMQNILENYESINAAYTLSRTQEFAQRQALKGGLIEAFNRYNQGNEEDLISDVQNILTRSLRAHQAEMDVGVFLNDTTKALRFLDGDPTLCSTGIPALDAVNLGPKPGQMLLLIGPKGRGKSWWTIDLGKKCLLQNKKVVHITLEMSTEQVIPRYYQAMFAAAQTNEPYNITQLELDQLGRITKLNRDVKKPKISFDDPRIRRLLGNKIAQFGARLGRLVVKDFATNYLTVAKIDAYLDYLELNTGFIPQALIIDYPDLMNMKGDLREALGRTFVELRGLLQRRKLAGIFPTQGNRTSWDADTTKASMVSEDASKVMTADMVLTLSQTPAEEALGLARLGVAHNRGGKDKFVVLLSQNYDTGQFALSSARMLNPDHYNELIKQANGGRNAEESSEEGEEAEEQAEINWQ